jgi:HAMP domain-containing protein
MLNISTSGIVRTVLVTSFVTALVVATGGAYLILHQRAVQRTAAEAGRMLTIATAVRGYTDQQIAPLLSKDDKLFHEQTVPAFAAQTVYRAMETSHPGYSYREPALKPTNPNDLPTPFEVELLGKFRTDPELKELTGVRDAAKGTSVYYLARPIRAQESCLRCHDTAQRAPAAMVVKYGPHNGFGWKLNEVVALQSLTVPAAEALKETGEIAMLLAGGLLLVFLATYFALSTAIEALVVRPLRSLEQAAEAASLGTATGTITHGAGAREIRSIAAAIERLRLSLGKALKRLADDASASR